MCEKHNCDGKIEKLLQFIPAQFQNSELPSWAITVRVDGHPAYWTITFCPMCGKELEWPDA